MFIFVILGLIIACFISRVIAGPIRLVDAAAAEIAGGDLTGEKIKITTKDEAGNLAESFNSMLASLKELAGHLQEKSQTVVSSATELTAGTENVAAGSAETASARPEPDQDGGGTGGTGRAIQAGLNKMLRYLKRG